MITVITVITVEFLRCDSMIEMNSKFEKIVADVAGVVAVCSDVGLSIPVACVFAALHYSNCQNSFVEACKALQVGQVAMLTVLCVAS